MAAQRLCERYHDLQKDGINLQRNKCRKRQKKKSEVATCKVYVCETFALALVFFRFLNVGKQSYFTLISTMVNYSVCSCHCT